MASLFAKFLLAWTLILQQLKKLVFWRRSGLRQFMDNYGAEGIFPLSSVDKDWIFKFSLCLNCGFCDTACEAILKFPREKFPGPSYLANALTRSPPDFWASGIDFSICQDCDLCQKACPNLVPVKEALEFIEAKLHEPLGSVA